MKGNFDLDLIAKVIVDTDPDFVALQEVDYKTNRSNKYDLVTELGWRTKWLLSLEEQCTIMTESTVKVFYQNTPF